MGGRGHGKTTVINLLLDQMNPPSNRGDISVYTGYVVADNTKEGVYLDMWELPGGRLLKSLYPVLLTEPAIYLVLVTADTHDPDVDVIDTCQNIMFKVHEPHIIVILTKTDSTKCRNINIGDLCLRIKDKWNEFTIKCRREIVNRSTLKAGIFPDTGAQFTVTGNSCSLVVHPFNASDSQVLQQLRRSLFKYATGVFSEGYDISIKPCLLRTIQLIQKKQKERVLFVTKGQFLNSHCDHPEKALNYLLKKDYVREFQSVSNDEAARVICVDPLAFSNLLVRSHLDSGGHIFRLEAGKFWPSNMDRKPPDPQTLAGVLEYLQSSGTVPESFLPLLWNMPYIREDQILTTLSVMENLGLICYANILGQARDATPELDMPFFTYLSGANIRHIMLMNKFTESKPSLHWSENPHKGDFQITVHFCCPCGMPIGLVLRILALCVNLNKPFTRYSYIWRHGVLIQLGHEVKIHIQAITNELDFTVRVVTDSYSDLKTATQVLWMTVAPSLVKLLRFFKCFPGLSTEAYLSFRGDPNFDEVFLRSTSDRRFTIDQLVSKQILRTELMSSRWLVPFKVNSTVKTFETWLEFLMTNRKDVLQILAPEMLYPLASNALPGIVRGDKNNRKAKQKTSKVTWDMDTKHTEPKNNNDSVNYSDSGGNNSKEVDKSPYHSNKTTSLPVRKISEKISKCRKEQTSTSNSEADKLFDEHAALRVASSLAAAVLSASVVRYMEEENSIIHTWSSAQVLAVRDISQLSSSVWEGNMANISSAITHAVAKDTRCHTKASKLCHSPAIQSTKFCTIL